VLLSGGSVRLEGRDERIREVTKLPADDFHLELVDLVGTNTLSPDLQWLTGLKHLKTLNVGENGQRPAGEESHARFTT
jgi:hypothetical protein